MLWGTRPQRAFPSVLGIIRPMRLKYADLGRCLSLQTLRGSCPRYAYPLIHSKTEDAKGHTSPTCFSFCSWNYHNVRQQGRQQGPRARATWDGQQATGNGQGRRAKAGGICLTCYMISTDKINKRLTRCFNYVMPLWSAVDYLFHQQLSVRQKAWNTPSIVTDWNQRFDQEQ